MTIISRHILVKRKCFSKKKNNIDLPNLIDVQSRSFNDFVQLDMLPEDRKNIGIEKVFRDVFPIQYNNSISLEYVGYELGNWSCACGLLEGIQERYHWICKYCKKDGYSDLKSLKTCSFCKKEGAEYKKCSECLVRVKIKPAYTPSECRLESLSFTFPLKIKLQLISWKTEKSTKSIKDVKEQSIFFLDLPVMVDIYQENDKYLLGSTGTFIINGVNRVVVSQIHRSAGVIFSLNKKTKDFGATIYSAKLIPMRGSWIDFEIDAKDLLYVRVDKTKKVLGTTFLQALGISRDEIGTLFYRYHTYIVKNNAINLKLDEFIFGMRIEAGMLPSEIESLFINKIVNSEILKRLQGYDIEFLKIKKSNIINKYIGNDIYSEKDKKFIAKKNDILTDSLYKKIIENEDVSFLLITSAGHVLNPIIHLTLQADKCHSIDDAVKELYFKMYPGDAAPLAEMKEKFNTIFFNNKFYDLTRVGRVKINRKLGLNIPETTLTITKEDLIATVRYLIILREQEEGEIDDIDHLGNRRVRLVGELLSNQIYSGLLKVERIVKERFRLQDSNKSVTPYDLINAKPLSGIIREFFSTGQLSQFLDQTNPLAELGHKRRLSCLGPGGVLKDRATYEVRDVHTSHYGRICPIETPEGQAIGLISSLAALSSVNELGFIETPYHPVINGKVQESVVFIDAFKESSLYIAQLESVENNKIKNSQSVLARYQGNFVYTDPKNIQYADISPNQLFSVATALIPFLQHNDAVRALMGSNMQRQAVPLICSQAPIVGTGLEKDITKASQSCLYASENGTVEYVSSKKIVIKGEKSSFNSIGDWLTQGVTTYNLKTFEGSSYNTLIHQKPIVKIGQKIAKDQILTNASAVKEGELALGTNLTVAYMPWNGYNYEDAIILSQRIVSENLLTSVHITEYTIDSRETRLGPEDITKDIPSISETETAYLDEDGIIKIGMRVKAGDILVGKVTLKGESQNSPEEKLLRAIFGEKSKEVRDTSLRVPAGVEGVVIDVKVFSRSGGRKDPRYKNIIAEESLKLKKEFDFYKKTLEKMVKEELFNITKSFFEYDQESYYSIDINELIIKIEKEYKSNSTIKKIISSFKIQLTVMEQLQKEKLSSLKSGDSLPSGVLKMVKVYIATMRRIQVGDKMAGRHGNKGVVSLILPREDMPFMEDGTPVDIVLNPLGVPSRMNLGQILEMILGLCGKKLGNQIGHLVNKNSEDSLKAELSKIYSKERIDQLEKEFGKEFILEFARYIAKNGIYFSTPIFDSGSFDNDIVPLLEKANLSKSGTYKLIDGRTGEFFDQKVMVGVMYIIKLNHMIDDKLHARSVGPYSLVTQQPLGGKAQAGGQRFGEMEVWALEAYGAANLLQELLTYKSDDITGRHKVYDSIVRGETIPEPGLPESFNVLVKELQALGLKIVLFKSDKESCNA